MTKELNLNLTPDEVKIIKDLLVLDKDRINAMKVLSGLDKSNLINICDYNNKISTIENIIHKLTFNGMWDLK